MSPREGYDLVITIDGPAGAGKSVAARALAERLGFDLVDTGALYRGLSWAVRESGIDPDDAEALAAVLARTDVTLDRDRVIVNGKTLGSEIRTPEISRLTSRLTALGPVRDKLTPLQRRLAARGRVILEGRDTGSVVWPDAEVKFYLDADLETRARRRWSDLRRQGIEMSLADVVDDVGRRDRQDRERALAPLTRPDGAVAIDTSGMDLDEVVESMLKVVETRCCTGS